MLKVFQISRRVLNAGRISNPILTAFKSTKVDSFLNGSTSLYAEQMYEAWLTDPTSVHVSWQTYFSNMDNNVDPVAAFRGPPQIVGSTGVAQVTEPAMNGGKSDSLGLSYLIKGFQTRGHEAANLDPLGLHDYRSEIGPPELDYKSHGFSDADLDRNLNLLGTSTGGSTGFLNILASRPNITLRNVIDNLQKTYCDTIGVEYMHMSDGEKRNWIRDKVEQPGWMQFDKEKKMHIYERVAFADHFEKYLGNKFNTAKRFGLEGGESCIAGLKSMIDRGSELGIESFCFGMPHRGRLNVLANVMRKPMPLIFKEFQGTHYDLDEYMREDWSSAGDVKYHLGTSMDRVYPDGRRVHLSLVANPSHLEAESCSSR
jgi:2-oxoglutarate dehydrogenase E1 component